jgi:hypothetical protein
MQKPKLSNPNPINMYLSQPISPLFTTWPPHHFSPQAFPTSSLSLSLSLSLCWGPLQINFLYLSSLLLFQITLASLQLYGLVFLSFLFLLLLSDLTTVHSQHVVLLLLIDFYLLVSPIFSVLLYFSGVSLLFIPCTCYGLHFLFFYFFFILFSSLLTIAFLVA